MFLLKNIELLNPKLINRSDPRKLDRQRGFTLVELLVVMFILVLLASLVGPRVVGYLGSSKVKTAKIQIESLNTTLELFKLDVGRYPNSNEGLEVLVSNKFNIRGWSGPYLKKLAVPKDPWGNDYKYIYPGRNGQYEIVSLGADNQQGGQGENRDISSSQ